MNRNNDSSITYSLWVPLGHINRPFKAIEISKESFVRI